MRKNNTGADKNINFNEFSVPTVSESEISAACDKIAEHLSANKNGIIPTKKNGIRKMNFRRYDFHKYGFNKYGLHRYGLIAACALLMILVVTAVPRLLNTKVGDTAEKLNGQKDASAEIDIMRRDEKNRATDSGNYTENYSENDIGNGTENGTESSTKSSTKSDNGTANGTENGTANRVEKSTEKNMEKDVEKGTAGTSTADANARAEQLPPDMPEESETPAPETESEPATIEPADMSEPEPADTPGNLPGESAEGKPADGAATDLTDADTADIERASAGGGTAKTDNGEEAYATSPSASPSASPSDTPPVAMSGLTAASVETKIETALVAGEHVDTVILSTGFLNFDKIEANGEAYTLIQSAERGEKWSMEKIIYEFGFDPRPEWLPEDLTLVSTEENIQVSISGRGNTQAVKAVFTYEVKPDGASRTLTAEVFKTAGESGIPADRFNSNVKGYNIYTEYIGNTDMYFARFIFCGVEYRINSEGLTQEEFVKVILSVIDKE